MLQRLRHGSGERGSMPLAMLLVVFTGFISVVAISVLTYQMSVTSSAQSEIYATAALDSGLAAASQSIGLASDKGCNVVTNTALPMTNTSTYTKSAVPPSNGNTRITPDLGPATWTNFWTDGGVTWAGTTATIPNTQQATWVGPNPAMTEGTKPITLFANITTSAPVTVSLLTIYNTTEANANVLQGTASTVEKIQNIPAGTTTILNSSVTPVSSKTFWRMWARITNNSGGVATVSFSDLGAYRVSSLENLSTTTVDPDPSNANTPPSYNWWVDRSDVATKGLLYATIQANSGSGDSLNQSISTGQATYKWSDDLGRWELSSWQGSASPRATGGNPAC